MLSGERPWALVTADSVDALPLLPSASIHHVITDPPYRPNIAGKVVRRHGSRARRFVKSEQTFGFEPLTDEVRAAAAQAFGRLSQRWCLVFCDVESCASWRDSLTAAGLRHMRVGAWVRQNTAPQFTGDRPAVGIEACVITHAKGKSRWNGGGRPAVWHHLVPLNAQSAGEEHERLHPTPKPLSLMLELVRLFTDAGDVVLDPFAGSGTTGVACLRLGRRFIGIEKNASFAAIARLRLEAESLGLSYRAHRAGQLPLFGFETTSVETPDQTATAERSTP